MYSFLKQNLANYQTRPFSKEEILIVTWKDQVQHSAIENTVFEQFLLRRTFGIITT